MKQLKQLFGVLLLVLVVTASIGCNKEDDGKKVSSVDDPTPTTIAKEENNDSKKEEEIPTPLPPLKLSIMLPYGSNDNDDDELVQRFYNDIETYTNTDIEFIFYGSDMYYEKLALTLASGDIPSILVVNKKAEFMNAIKNDAFWDITDYINDYENLSFIPDVVFQNAAINGRLYGVPRSRELGRNAFGYRLDWLNNLGLKEPETIDELYDMLVGFTYDDPDGNGKNDTYGLGVTEYAGTWDVMQVWFGVPNGWGLDENGDLIPAHMTEEYNTALAWFRKLYDEGLVNPDFLTIPGGQWSQLLFHSGLCGATADVAGRFRQIQEYFEKEGIPAEFNIIGSVDAGYGRRVLPTAGYGDLLAISKLKVTTEDDLKRALQFLDDMCDAEMVNLVDFGYEGITHKIDENGYGVYLTGDEQKELGVPTNNYRAGMNQLLPYFASPEEEAKRIKAVPPATKIRQLEADVQIENRQYAVSNPAGSYTSATYEELSGMLNPIIADARIAYIMGEIDDASLQEAKDQWLRAGGQAVIDETNELYRASKNE